MSVNVQMESDGRILIVRASGKLKREDYEEFVPITEGLIRRHGKIRVLFEMQEFHGWQAGALWEDVKFDLRHFSDIERIAFVGETTWEKWMAIFCRPFTTAKIRYFQSNVADLARNWIYAELPVETA